MENSEELENEQTEEINKKEKKKEKKEKKKDKKNEKEVIEESGLKKLLLIVNPTSGQDRKRFSPKEIIAAFAKDKYEFDLHITTCQGDATNIVKNYGNKADLVVCCGGDGTLNETINGVMQIQKRIPIGYIPMGSTNDLAATIGIPTNLKEAVATIESGIFRGYDIGLFNNRFFSYVASFGPATRLSYSTSQKLKNKLGHSAYMLNGFLFQLIPSLKEVKPVHIKVEYDDGVLDDIFYFAAISNSTSVAGLFNFNRNDVRLNDGKFEIMLVRNLKNPLQAFPMLEKIIKKDYDGKSLIMLHSSTVKMTFDEPHAWTLDGEYGGEHKEIRFSVLNRTVDLFCNGNELFI